MINRIKDISTVYSNVARYLVLCRMFETDKIVKLYDELGFSNKEILQLLAHSDGVIISVSTVKEN
jgi:hypothetical protein